MRSGLRHLWDQAKVEADVALTHVTIVEVRPDWRGGPELTRFPIAWLRYRKTAGTWAIYWRDRDLKFHEYQYKQPSKNVQELLDYIRESKDPIFFGFSNRLSTLRTVPAAGRAGKPGPARTSHGRRLLARPGRRSPPVATAGSTKMRHA